MKLASDPGPAAGCRWQGMDEPVGGQQNVKTLPWRDLRKIAEAPVGELCAACSPPLIACAGRGFSDFWAFGPHLLTTLLTGWASHFSSLVPSAAHPSSPAPEGISAIFGPLPPACCAPPCAASHFSSLGPSGVHPSSSALEGVSAISWPLPRTWRAPRWRLGARLRPCRPRVAAGDGTPTVLGVVRLVRGSDDHRDVLAGVGIDALAGPAFGVEVPEEAGHGGGATAYRVPGGGQGPSP